MKLQGTHPFQNNQLRQSSKGRHILAWFELFFNQYKLLILALLSRWHIMVVNEKVARILRPTTVTLAQWLEQKHLNLLQGKVAQKAINTSVGKIYGMLFLIIYQIIRENICVVEFRTFCSGRTELTWNWNSQNQTVTTAWQILFQFYIFANKSKQTKRRSRKIQIRVSATTALSSHTSFNFFSWCNLLSINKKIGIQQ